MKKSINNATSASTMADFSAFDEQSVDFSVDPDMYTKLDVKKAKLGEENPFDRQKIYNFQLEKDIKKLAAKKGPYKERVKRHLKIRQMDEDYKRVAVPSDIATHGNFIEILEYTTEESWKATTRPYGIQAHKRYLDYIANIPKGPTDEQIRDKQQRAMDKDLWDNIITGKTELTKKEIRQKEKEAIERMEQIVQEGNELEHVRRRRIWREHLQTQEFEKLRTLPTEREFDKSMNKWSKGLHYPYDWEEGFPFVAVDSLEGTNIVRERNPNESMKADVKYSAEKFVGGSNDGADQEYLEHMVSINLNKVDKYLKNRRKEMVREQKMAEELRLIREKQRRRAARVERHDLASTVIHAKFNVMQSSHQKTKKIKTTKGLLDPDEGEQEGQVEVEAEDDWSDSDSSGGFGGGGGKKTEGADANADDGVVLKREHQTINVDDIARLNESLSPKKKAKIATQSPQRSNSAIKRKSVNVASPDSGNGSPARRGLVAIPKFTFDEAGNAVVAPADTGEDTGAENDEFKAREESKNDDVSSNDGDGIGNRGSSGAGAQLGGDNNNNDNGDNNSDGADQLLEGGIDPLADNSKYGNKSTKYSAKYRRWEPGAAFVNIGVPDFMRLRSSKQNSASVAPAGAAYKVKNYKQRHVAVKFVIHYMKKLHPKRILHMAIRSYRWCKKYYTKHFTNTDGLTRSEREKQATLRKLDRLTTDAASGEYHKSVVALAANEIPSEEFLPYAKRKRRMFQKEIARYENMHCTADDLRMLDMIKKRSELHDEIYDARLAREKKAKQRSGMIQRYIADSRALVEATSNFSFLDRQRIRLRTMRQDMVQRTVQLKNAGKQQEHILPEYDKHENDDMIQAMHDARLEDRKKSAWKRKYRRRWNYMLTGDKSLLEDEDERVRDVVDLILAARSGNYIEVMDIVMHPTDPVSPNAMNEDGLTATYATLLMILKREVLDSEADLAMLGMSKWERFCKLFAHKKENEPKLDLVLRCLLFMGGNVDFRFLEPSVDGVAAMHNACEAGACDMVDWLLKKGTDMNIRTTLQNKTPLMVALEHNQLEVVNLLLRRGVMLHLDLVDAKGWTALHYAAVYARPELAVILLTCGSKPNLRNHAGRLPSEEARSRGRMEMATCIMTFKSDVVVVRARLDNLMNRTDDHYRKHKLKRTIHKHEGGGGGHVISNRDRGRETSEEGAESTALVAGASLNTPNTVLLPPIQRRPQFLDPSALAEAGDTTNLGAAPDLTRTGAPPVDRPLGAAADAENPQERAKREVYERRMSSIVAQADPWNLAPHTKPRPLGIAKMSFYPKKPAPSTK